MVRFTGIYKCLENKRRKEPMNMIAIGILLFVVVCELAAIYGKMEEKKHE